MDLSLRGIAQTHGNRSSHDGRDEEGERREDDESELHCDGSERGVRWTLGEDTDDGPRRRNTVGYCGTMLSEVRG